MAVNASKAQGVVIDLTNVDEDDDDAVAPGGFRPGPFSTSSSLPPRVSNGENGVASPSFPPSVNAPCAPTSKHIEPRVSLTQPSQYLRSPQSLPPPHYHEAEGHLSKRRKLQNSAGYKATPSVTNAKALTQCLQTQVFPHLEQAVRKLDPDVYDVEKLGGKIIGRIADSDFERHFHNGNGRISPDVEASVIVRIHELVAEFTMGPDFRRRPTPVQPTPISTQKSIAQSTPFIPTPTENLPSAPILDGGDDDDEDGVEGPFYDDVIPSREADVRYTTPPQTRPKKKPPATPQQLRTRVKATQWQSGKSYEFKKELSPLQVKSRWFGLTKRPYLSAEARSQITAGLEKGRLFRLQPDELRQPSVYHVDFSGEEIRYLCYLARCLQGRSSAGAKSSDLRNLRHLIKKSSDLGARILDMHRRGYDQFEDPPFSLLQRSADDVRNFIDDLRLKRENQNRQSLYLERDDGAVQGDVSKKNIVPSLLLAREVVGNRLGATRRYQNFSVAFRNNREDHLEPKVEWTNCAGDIMTISWLPDATRFVCGTTTHSDSHNQQYNKPGNLLFGDTMSNTLKAYPDHRIPRPLVTHGDNALESMRESQDPWLYTSVVSSDYDPVFDFAFTSSFDNTVKVWHSPAGTMTLRETWHHEGRVNFVVTNKNKKGSKIATAADVPTRAVRVYHTIRDESGHLSKGYTYDEFSCKRVHGEDYVPSDKWAYFPSAIRWGIEPSVNHLLLIGYSPRSLNNDDSEIPEDKRDTGELCLWDTNTNTEVKVNSAATSNVFEVVWHPYRASFAAATSASQTSEKIEEHIRTQIRIFELNEMTGQYGVVKTLDCPAIDINELAIRPNSTLYSYVAAGCTNGKVYVWDSNGTEDPMCVLEHGDPVEEIIGDREQEDVGVKFMAWATTPDRLYTGSSDGVVKVWNIRHGRGVLVKDLIEVAAPITAGAFSPDFTKLLIGDGSGRVYLMDMEDSDGDGDKKNSSGNSAATSSGFFNLQLNGTQRSIRRPRPFIPHDEIPPPPSLPPADQSATTLPLTHTTHPPLQLGQARAREFLRTSQLILHPDPTVGAVQGPAYAATRLFRAEAHLGGDAAAPLLSAFETRQRANQGFARTTRVRRQKRLVGVGGGRGTTAPTPTPILPPPLPLELQVLLAGGGNGYGNMGGGGSSNASSTFFPRGLHAANMRIDEDVRRVFSGKMRAQLEAEGVEFGMGTGEEGEWEWEWEWEYENEGESESESEVGSGSEEGDVELSTYLGR